MEKRYFIITENITKPGDYPRKMCKLTFYSNIVGKGAQFK
jgi:hypothetical protein